MSQPIESAPSPPRPVALPLRPDQVPAALRAYDHFLVWEWRLRRGKGGPTWTKPPLKVTGDGQARSTDPADWGGFREAVATWRARQLPGIGFALAADDPFVFGDVDDCRDPETGDIAAWAQPLLARFRHTYQEASPSGTGVKIVARGILPGASHKLRLDPADPLAFVEWFDRGKYTTLTGHRLPDAAADVGDVQAALDALYAEARPEPAKPAVHPPPSVPVAGLPDDDALLQKARSSKDGPRFIQLFDSGNTALYGGDESAADIALCGMLAFWLGPDPERIDRVFRRSALVRDKWLDRQDYRDLTIGKVLAGRTEFYAPKPTRRLTVVDPAAEALAPRTTRWTAADLLAAELPEPRWAVPDLIPEGLTVFAGRPKKGKSRLALCLAVAAASGTPALDWFEVDGGGDVLFVGMEDGPRRLQDRLSDLLGSRPAPPTLELWTELPKLGEGCEEELARWIGSHPNGRLIVLDTYQRIRKPAGPRDQQGYAVDYEEAAALQRMALGSGRAIVLILHTRKNIGAADPFDDVMGTTGNTAAADAILVLDIKPNATGRLLVTGRDIEQAEHAVESDRLTGGWRRIGEASDVQRSAQRAAILAALRAAPGGLKPRQIAEITRTSSNNVRQLLYKMRGAGEVVVRAGTYLPPATLTQIDSEVATTDNGDHGITDNRITKPGGEAPATGDFVTSLPVIPLPPLSATSRSWMCDCGTQVMRGYPCPTCGCPEDEPP